jgi:hypothetical protein
MLNKELKVDVAVMKLIKDIQHRLLSPELVEGWREPVPMKIGIR